ncbi:hypothetical protein GCM10018980_44790 [Streptomyces capoamus]|uniref:Uncharacterized protein n=1 Tax=Streptomyces capoamus TaxID=68183 RepID=A0A919EY23_9ACTN|nr:hypothetical protein GCM10010501_63510 [Streptomyces libani subsp. rufus]GHG57990.1 hypothetical protein GCM10018980_44790 [Streptomyces capoamus]
MAWKRDGGPGVCARDGSNGALRAYRAGELTAGARPSDRQVRCREAALTV